MITRLHSRAAHLNRKPNLYSPIRITPANYFRFLEGPSQTVIKGREFIIPVVTMTGLQTQIITFDSTPTEGGFYLTYDGEDTDVIAFDDNAAVVQTELRGLPNLNNQIEVTGSFAAGFTVKFYNVQAPELLVASQDVAPLDAEISISISSVLWDPIIKRGDRIIDSVLGQLAIDEIIDIHDLGGDVMGYRVRTE